MPDNDTYETEPQGVSGSGVVGTEIEYPIAPNNETTFTEPGQYSGNIRDTLRREFEWPNAQVGNDPTAGVEVRNIEPVSPMRLAEWYEESISKMKRVAAFEPTGYANGSGNASSFGLHIHISPLTEEQARGLFNLSQEPWFKPFVCTSIVSGNEETYQVFRNRYCPMNINTGPHSSNDCVTYVENIPDQNGDHWEWRLVEPMTIENFKLLMRFIEILQTEGIEAAGEYAKHFVQSADTRVTSIRRASEIGLVEQLQDEDEQVVIERAPYATSDNVESEAFFESVVNNVYAPYIYHVTQGDNHYYALFSESFENERTFRLESDDGVFDEVELRANGVVNAETLDIITDSNTVEQVQQHVEDHRNSIETDNDATKTEETDAIVRALQDQPIEETINPNNVEIYQPTQEVNN